MMYRKLTKDERYKLAVMYHDKKYKYILLEDISYTSKDGKTLSCQCGELSNGADSAIDLCPEAFFLHDKGCVTGKWDDGSAMTNYECSTMYSTVLWKNGHWLPALYRFPATFLFGGNKCRENMW